jgi:3-methyl-2-oxobutanoate hydroxymethyltransferase
MLGLNREFNPRFVRRYADLHTVIDEAVAGYVRDIKSMSFPNKDEQYD